MRPFSFVLPAALFLACPQPPCNQSTCAGCCDPLGVCRSGNELRACGRFGEQCFLCAPGACNGVCLDGGRVLRLDDLDSGMLFDAGPPAFDAGTVSRSCNANRECNVGQVCHPALRQCVSACRSSADCIRPNDTCAPVVNITTDSFAFSGQVCQCSTDSSCQDQGRTGLCQPGSLLCAPPCRTNAECLTGLTCDALTGRCDIARDGGTGCLFQYSRTTMDECSLTLTCSSTFQATCMGASCTCVTAGQTTTRPVTTVRPCATPSRDALLNVCGFPQP